MRSIRMTVWMVMMVLCFGLTKTQATIFFDDGLTHNIDYEISEDVKIDYDSPEMKTTVNFVPNGDIINGYELYAYYDSQVNILGGRIRNRMHLSGNSQLQISSGIVGEYSLYANALFDTTQANVSGGFIYNGFNLTGNSSISITGGSLHDVLSTNDQSTAIISGGIIYDDNVQAWGDSQMIITGTDFRIDGEYVGYGEIFVQSGTLTGILSNGDLLDTRFGIYESASIILIPEPATLFLLGLGAVMLRKRKS